MQTVEQGNTEGSEQRAEYAATCNHNPHVILTHTMLYRGKTASETAAQGGATRRGAFGSPRLIIGVQVLLIEHLDPLLVVLQLLRAACDDIVVVVPALLTNLGCSNSVQQARRTRRDDESPRARANRSGVPSTGSVSQMSASSFHDVTPMRAKSSAVASRLGSNLHPPATAAHQSQCGPKSIVPGPLHPRPRGTHTLAHVLVGKTLIARVFGHVPRLDHVWGSPFGNDRMYA